MENLAWNGDLAQETSNMYHWYNSIHENVAMAKSTGTDCGSNVKSHLVILLPWLSFYSASHPSGNLRKSKTTRTRNCHP